MLNFKSVKTQMIIYLVCFALFLALRERDPRFLIITVIAVLASIAFEFIAGYLKTKSLQISESSIITGLIVGFVLSSDELWWKFIFASLFAISSKYLIRFQKRHIFNPAALGIFLTLVLLGASTEWKATYIWYILVPFGLYFAYKFKKLEIIISYSVVSLLLFGIQAFLLKIPLGNIFGYFSYFYIFIMVIEPKTTPLKLTGKYIFGTGLAILIFILTGMGARFDVELLSLLVMNATVPLLNRMPLKQGGLV